MAQLQFWQACAEGRGELLRERESQSPESKTEAPETEAVTSIGEGVGGRGDYLAKALEAIFSEQPAPSVSCLNTCPEVLAERLVVLRLQLRRALMPNYLP